MQKAEVQAAASMASLVSLRMLGLFMLFPVLSIYASDLQGATPWLVGLALGGYGLTQGLLQIPMGILSDLMGRKQTLALGMIIFIIGSLVAAMSTSIYGVVAGRILQGAGAIAGVALATVADVTSEQNRSKAMAMIGMSIGMSFALALVLGPVVTNWLGLSGLFWASAALGGLGLALILGWLPEINRPVETKPTTDQVQQSAKEAWQMLKKDFQMQTYCVGVFVLHLSMTAFFLVVPKLLKLNDLALGSHWMVYLFVLFLSFVLMVPVMIAGEKMNRTKQVFCMAIVSVAIAMGLIALPNLNFTCLVALMLLYLFGFNLLEAMLPSLMSKRTSISNRGMLMGAFSSSQFLGAFAGGLIGGAMMGWFGFAGVIYLCLTTLALWLLLALRMQPVKLRSE